MHVLYYAPDNASLVVRLLLEELATPYEARLVDRSRREQASEAYRALNPMGRIPVCVIDGEPVSETAAILLALTERHGAFAPPPGSPERPGLLKWLFFLSNTLHADLRQAFYPAQYAGDDPTLQAAFRLLVEARLANSLEILEQAYATTAQGDRPYLLGPEPSVVDLYLAVCVRWMQLYPMAAPLGFDASAHPALHRMIRALEQRPAIARACAREGIAAPFFSAPSHATPPEGSAV